MKRQTTMAAQGLFSTAKRHSSIARNLLATLFSSWMMAPLGVLMLHLTGLSSDRYLITILVALGVGAPFQLMLNEFLAVSQARDRYAVSKSEVAALAAIHLAACLLALGTEQPTLAGLNIGNETVTIALLVTINLILSFASVWHCTRLVLAGRIGTAQSIVNGGLTGVATLVLYGLAAATASRVFLALVLILPGSLHLGYFAWLYRRSGIDLLDAPPPRKTRAVVIGPLLMGSMLLVGTTYGGSVMRFALAENYPAYAAPLLIMVNVMSTAAFTMTRFSFLSQRQHKHVSHTAHVTLALFGLTLLSYLLAPQGAPLFAVVCINSVNIWIIEALRHQSNLKSPHSSEI